MQINPAWVEMVDEMNQRLIYVLKDAVECRCRPNIDDIDAQNILFSIEESEQLRAKVAELEAKLAKYDNLKPVAYYTCQGNWPRIALAIDGNYDKYEIPLYALEK